MRVPHPIADWTVAQVLELPDDGNRYEVVDGELLVSLAPALPHQEAVQALYERLKTLDTPPLTIDLPQLFAEILDAKRRSNKRRE
jgi:hypothetical protein